MSGQTWQVFIKSVAGKSYPVDASEKMTVKELEEFAGKAINFPEGTFYLMYAGKRLESQKRLSDYNIQKGSTIFVLMWLHGGIDPRIKLKLKKRELRALPGFITLTKERCMISCDDDPDTNRAKMPCGHVIGCDGMTGYARSLLEEKKYRFICPDEKCTAEWPYFLVCHVGCLDEEEMKSMEEAIMSNYASKHKGIGECIDCKALLHRADDMRGNFTSCPFCKREKGAAYKGFCWSCQQEWVNPPDAVNCGNDGCKGDDHFFRLLGECPKKDLFGVQCPTIRACPECHVLISHKEGCKHMTCPCGHQFCFICLSAKGSVGWSCGSFNEGCPAAPVQQALDQPTRRPKATPTQNDKSNSECVIC